MSELKSGGFSAVIFDMDGLVLDTDPTYTNAWQKAAFEMGFELTETFCLSLSGLNHQTIQQRLRKHCGTDFDWDAFAQLSGQIWREHVNQHGIEVKEGVLELVVLLKSKNIPYCIGTNSSALNALECLKLAQVEEIFPQVITLDQVKQGKPAPDIFLLAAKEMNVSISECLVLEDSKTGIVAADKAGAISAFIPSLFPVDLEASSLASYCFDSAKTIVEGLNESYAKDNIIT